MIPVIEQILQTDESAQKQVAAARAESGRIIREAEQAAQQTLTSRQNELNEAVRAEQEHALAQARLRASRIAEETDMYIDQSRHNMQAVHHDLVESLIRKVIGI